MQFTSKKNRLAHPLWQLAPPQENPGSATGKVVRSTFVSLLRTYSHKEKANTKAKMPVRGGNANAATESNQ